MAGSLSNPLDGVQRHCHKQQLWEFAQRSLIPFPVYQTLNEGPQHFSQYRSTVVVGEKTFASPSTFHKRKDAERYVAKIALESIVAKMNQETMQLLHHLDATFYKAILHEFADKMKMKLPTYTTSIAESPTFIALVIFDRRTYVGLPARNKKEAEQIAARIAIEWILGHSGTSTIMAEIIKSRVKLMDALCKAGGSYEAQDDNIPLQVPLDSYSGSATVLHENHVHLEVPENNHFDDTIARGENVHIVSTDGNLPGQTETRTIMEVITESKGKHVEKSCGAEKSNIPFHVPVVYHPVGTTAKGKDMHAGSIVPHENNEHSKADDTVTEGGNLDAGSTNGTFPGYSETSTIMEEITKSKSKCIDESCGADGSNMPQDDDIPFHLPVDIPPVGTIAKGKQMHAGSVATHDNNEPVKVSLDSHTDNAKGGNLNAASINGKLLGEHTLRQAKEYPKEQCVSDACSRSIGANTSQSTQLPNDQPAGSTSKPSNSVSDDSCLEKTIQIQGGVTREDPPILPRESNSPRSTSSRKRLRRKSISESGLKKVRKSERLAALNAKANS